MYLYQSGEDPDETTEDENDMPDPEDSERFVIDHVEAQDADGVLGLHSSRDSWFKTIIQIGLWKRRDICFDEMTV